MAKYLLDIILSKLSSKEKVVGNIDFLKLKIKSEFFILSYIFFTGIIVTSVIVFSFFQIGGSLQNILKPTDYSNILSLALFSSLAIGGLFLLKSKFKNKTEIERLDSNEELKLAVDSFARGFMMGLSATNNKKRKIR